MVNVNCLTDLWSTLSIVFDNYKSLSVLFFSDNSAMSRYSRKYMDGRYTVQLRIYLFLMTQIEALLMIYLLEMLSAASFWVSNIIHLQPLHENNIKIGYIFHSGISHA